MPNRGITRRRLPVTGQNDPRYTELLAEALTGRLNRREVLRRSVVMGLSIPAIGALLAACGDDDDDDADPTNTTGSGQPSATEPAGDATATEGDEEESPTSASGDATPTESMGGGEMSLDNPPEVANADDASAYSGASLTYYGDGVGIGNQLDETLAAKFTEETGIEIEVIPRPENATESYATTSASSRASRAISTS